MFGCFNDLHSVMSRVMLMLLLCIHFISRVRSVDYDYVFSTIKLLSCPESHRCEVMRKMWNVMKFKSNIRLKYSCDNVKRDGKMNFNAAEQYFIAFVYSEDNVHGFIALNGSFKMSVGNLHKVILRHWCFVQTRSS